MLVSSFGRDAQNERYTELLLRSSVDRRSSSSVAAAAPSQQQLRRSSTIQSSTQMDVSLCVYLLEVLLSAPRGGTRRHLEDRDASCCGRAAAAPSQQQQQATAVSRDDERSTGDFLLRVDGSFSFESVTRSHHSRPPSLLLLLQLFTQPIFSLEKAGCHSPCGSFLFYFK